MDQRLSKIHLSFFLVTIVAKNLALDQLPQAPCVRPIPNSVRHLDGWIYMIHFKSFDRTALNTFATLRLDPRHLSIPCPLQLVGSLVFNILKGHPLSISRKQCDSNARTLADLQVSKLVP